MKGTSSKYVSRLNVPMLSQVTTKVSIKRRHLLSNDNSTHICQSRLLHMSNIKHAFLHAMKIIHQSSFCLMSVILMILLFVLVK
jgi:hypothetical protein